MANTSARFKVVDIVRILKASKSAKTPVRVVIEGETITIETLENGAEPIENSEPIVL